MSWWFSSYLIIVACYVIIFSVCFSTLYFAFSSLQACLTVVLANLLTGVMSLVPEAEDKQEADEKSILSYAPEWVS